MAEYIIRENEREKGCAQESIDETKNRILKAAGNLIKAEIREQIYTNEYYPSIDDIASKDWIPNNLQKLLRVLIQSEVKVQSIGQAIIKSSTRTALTPILFGLGVELDHVFGSKWLFDHLARLGFSVTSDEVKLQFVRCKCKADNRRFSISICSCGKHGLECVSSCGTCRGKSCENNVRHLIFISHFYKGSKRSERTISLYGSRTIAP